MKMLTLLGIFICSFSAYAINGRTTYQAKIVKPDGYPLEAASVNFRFTILDPAGSCVLYIEDYAAVNMTGTGGLISFALGAGTRTYPVSSTTFASIFDNSTVSFPCQSPGIYNPTPVDARKIVMQFNDSSGWQTLPAMAINAVPFAMYAGKSENAVQLNGKSDTNFVEYSTLASLSCASDQAIRFNGIGFSCITVGGGGITSVTTSGTVLVTGGTASAPVISIKAVTMSQDGYLTSLDYAEFKAKLAASSTQIVNTLGYAPVSGAAVATQINNSNLSGDVSGTVSSNFVQAVGGKTASQISTSVNDTLAATASATADTIVKRNSSGNATFNDIYANAAKINYVDIYRPSSSFNVRLQASTSLSANYVLNLPTTSGTLGQVLSTDGSGNLSWINPSTGSVVSVSATAPLASTGGSNPTISITQANSTTNGYLSSTDWNTFNNKQNATSAAIIATLGYTPADNAVSGTYLQKANNLSDLASVATARANLGLGTLAVGNSIDLGSASATGTLAIARLPSFIGDATIVAASNTIILSNSGVTAGTYTKVTVDAKGRVTSSSTLSVDDVTTALGYTPASATASTQWTTSGSAISYNSGNVGIGTFNPSAKLELTSGTASVAPLKFTSGTLLSSAQSGTMEYDGFNFYLTDANNTRRTIATGSSVGTIDNASNINSLGNITMTPVGSVIVSSTTASTNSSTGALVVKGGLGVAGNINTAGDLNVSGSQVIDGSLKLSSMTSGSVLFAGANGTVTQDNSSFFWDNANKRLGVGTATPSSQLNIGGNISSSAWGSGIAFKTNPATYNDTSSSGTVSTNYVNFFGTPTLTASAATTYTNAATLVINGAPIASTNVTNTNSHALLVNSGQSTFLGNTSLGTTLSFGKLTTSGFGGASSNEGIYQLGSAPAVGSATAYSGIKSSISQALTSGNQTGSLTGFTAIPSANVGAGLTTSEVLGFYAVPAKNGATTGTLTNLVGFKSSPVNSSDGVVTNLRSIWITNPTNAGAGSITNSYGLYIDNITTGTNKWSIYSNGGDSYFASNVGIGTTNPNEKLVVSGGNIVASGLYASGPVLVNPSAGAHMIWYPRKAAFRVGNLTGTAWNETNIGNHSLGIGTDSNAPSLRAIAIGHATTATGGNDPVAIGTSAYANNGGAAAIGMLSRANGAQSLALGTYATSEVFQETVIGPYNVLSVGNANAWVNTDPLFVVANGLSTGARSNAMTILKNGNVGIGTTTSSADLEIATSGSTYGRTRLWGRTSNAAIEFWKDNSPSYASSIGMSIASGSIATNDLVFNTFSSGSGWAEKMRLTNSGNVGIGTSAPTTKLEVAGNIFSNQNDIIYRKATSGSGPTATELIALSNFGIISHNDNTVAADTSTISSFASSRTTTTVSIRNAGLGAALTVPAGNVGIGTTAPTQKLEIVGGNLNIPTGYAYFNAGTTAGTQGIASSDSGAIYGEHDSGTETSRLVLEIFDNVNDQIVLRTNAQSGGSNIDMVRVQYNTVMLAPTSGNVGIGTTTLSEKVNIGTDGRMMFTANSSWGASFVVGGNGRGTLTDASIMTTNGNLHLDARNGGYGTYLNWYSASTTGVHIGNGATTYGTITASNYATASDRRLKENIHLISEPLSKVSNLRGVTFNWKNDGQKDIGFIAQEVENVLPELVKDNHLQNGEEVKTVKYSNVVAVLVEAIKEFYQKWLNDSELKNREIASLKEENADLKKQSEMMRMYLCEKDPNAPICK